MFLYRANAAMPSRCLLDLEPNSRKNTIFHCLYPQANWPLTGISIAK